MKFAGAVLVFCLGVLLNKASADDSFYQDESFQDEPNNRDVKEEHDSIDNENGDLGISEDHSVVNSLSCNFENNTCGWTNDANGDFFWTRNRGSTPSFQTGPSGDHTTGQGWYMYIETSSPRRLGEVARLISAGSISRFTTMCLTFWYHMYGSTIGNLRVLAIDDRNSSRTLFSLSGNQGNIWRQARVLINLRFFFNSNFKLVFQGTAGNDFTGDIAIDDVSVVRTGSCNQITTTSNPWPTTTPSSCFCFNGGSPQCFRGRLIRCFCFGGFFGNRCQFRTTTSRPTPTSPPRFCYQCAGSPGQCRQTVVRCPSMSSMCISLRYTLSSNGRDVEFFGCATLNLCRTACSLLRQRGLARRCFSSCCSSNFCNRRVRSTTRRPISTRPTAPPVNTRFFLKLLLKLLDSFKNLIETMTALLKAHLSSNDARFKKREVVSMMKRVDDASRQLEDSKDPETLQAQMDVAETRSRAKDLISKLDAFIDDESAEL